MKKLIIMRHAKSDWADDSLKDFDRPLNSRGLKAAPRMGSELKNLGIIPDLIISSPANRAKTTAEMFAKENGYTKQIVFNDDFYFGAEEDILKAIKSVDNSINTLMIIAHNPTLEILATNLTIENEFLPFKTATVAILTSFMKKWSDLRPQSFDIESHINPKSL
ncbi:MAG: histidine phosphatase family protein [Bacteroidales bacterium]|nr:histidine phosphatase family protein [Bacteroidales bacterium]